VERLDWEVKAGLRLSAQSWIGAIDLIAGCPPGRYPGIQCAANHRLG
jgi:hypothetical protein